MRLSCGCRSLVVFCLFAALAAGAGERLPLAGGWRVQRATTADEAPAADQWTAIPPGNWPTQRYGRHHAVWYERALEVPATWEGSRVLLDFHRLEGDAIIFCNDRRVGELLRPGGEFELTGAVAWGAENVLRVFVTREYAGISRGFEEDPLRYRVRGPRGRNLPPEQWGLGLTAPVELLRRPTPAAIAGVFVETSWRRRELAVAAELEATAPVAGARLELAVADAAGETVLTAAGAPLNLPAGGVTWTVTAAWADPIPWELDAPYLYTLTVRLLGPDGKLLDTLAGQRFGFREVWTEGRDVYLNGHVSRWRIEWTNFGINEHSVSLLKLLGRNVLYAQNNPTAWWANWNETPYYGDLLDLLDEQGIGMLLPAPSVSTIRDLLLQDAVARADFQREMALWLRRYRNHPSILAWCISMNSFNPRDAIHPDTLGRRADYTHSQARALEDAADIVRAGDPTRLVYGHADGNLTDIATANVYPNWAPVQEVEDWPERWAESGDMPYFAAEYELPYNGDFYNGPRFFGTELAAIHFGNAAYEQESDDLRRATIELGLGNTGHGNSIGQAIPNFPLFWKVRELYVTRNDRAWRTWGVLAWHYFNFGVGYGDPPGFTGPRPFNRYSAMTEPVSGRPDWANPNFDLHRVAMQPLLAYLGGAPAFTDKTHAYFAGEAVAKQIVIVWDGPGAREFEAAWQVRRGGEVLAGETLPVRAAAGDVRFLPVAFTAPEVADRTELELTLTVTEAGDEVAADAFALRVFPRETPPASAARTAIWDPQGRTAAWLPALGVTAAPIEPGAPLDGYDLLLIGREALTPGARLPWTPADLERGLNVVIFAQQPRMWEALGFLPDDLMSRRVFPNVAGHPVLAGLEAADLRDWRGSPDLLPAFRRVYGHDGPRAPRSSNRGTVASVVLRLPEAVGFTPLLNAEFDLDYAPLLHFRHGRGALWFCTLDLSGRIGVDPVATRLAANLLTAAARPAPPPASVEVLTPDADALRAAGFVLEPKTLHHAAVPEGPLFTGIGPRFWRWRDALTVDAFAAAGQPAGSTVLADGLMLRQRTAAGDRLYLRLSPDLLADRYADEPPRRNAIQTSVWRLRQLTARLLTNAGAEADPAVVARLSRLQAGPAYETLGAWHVLGPFYPEDAAPAAALDAAFPGEDNAIAGDTNPNFTYDTADGRRLDFRTIVTADDNDYLDLSAALEPAREAAVAYVTRTFASETAREAVLRLGVDYFMQVWVNGEVVYRLTGGHGAPMINRHQVKVNLKVGDNVITLKILAGSKGFGFWANLSTPDGGEPPAGAEDAPPPVSLYPPDINAFDPYVYRYW